MGTGTGKVFFWETYGNFYIEEVVAGGLSLFLVFKENDICEYIRYIQVL
jgi:hypothetical protein